MLRRLSRPIVYCWRSRDHVALELEPIHAPARTGALGLPLYVQVTPLIPTMNVVKSDYGHVIAYSAQPRPPRRRRSFFNGDWRWVRRLVHYPVQASLPKPLPPSTPPGLDPAQAQPVLENLLVTSKRIWVLPAAVTEPSGLAL